MNIICFCKEKEYIQNIVDKVYVTNSKCGCYLFSMNSDGTNRLIISLIDKETKKVFKIFEYHFKEKIIFIQEPYPKHTKFSFVLQNNELDIAKVFKMANIV